MEPLASSIAFAALGANVIATGLLRVLEERRITRVGETPEREVDVRVVAATNGALDMLVEHDRFRDDLL